MQLMNDTPITDDLRSDLHSLRKYWNKWVHVNASWDDQVLIDTPEEADGELEEMALFAARALRRTIYENRWV